MGPPCLVVDGGVDNDNVIQKSMTVIFLDTRNDNVSNEQLDIPLSSARTETAVMAIGNSVFDWWQR